MEEQGQKLVMPPEEGVDQKAWRSATALTNAEVALLLAKYEDQKRLEHGGGADAWQPHPHVAKTRAHLARLRLSGSEDAVQAVRTFLQQFPLHEFELALLANLAPENADEAQALVPSLKDGRFTAEELDALLAELAGLENA